MLVAYIDKALHRAHYEILTEDGTYYGEIDGFQGVYANAPTLKQCREDLSEVLEEWLFLRISRKLAVPVVDGIELKVQTAG